MEIKAVVFDYGGVICFPPDARALKNMEEAAGLQTARLADLNRAYRGEYDRGVYDGAGYYRFMLSRANIFPDDKTLRHIAQTDMDGWKRLNPATLELMHEIKAAGFILAILSNMPCDFLEWARKNIAVFGEVDSAIFSCEHKVIKPETAIYERLAEQIKCDFKDIVFFDDIADNIAKAAGLGIHGFVWTGADAARETLKNFGGAFGVL